MDPLVIDSVGNDEDIPGVCEGGVMGVYILAFALNHDGEEKCSLVKFESASQLLVSGLSGGVVAATVTSAGCGTDPICITNPLPMRTETAYGSIQIDMSSGSNVIIWSVSKPAV